MNKDEKLNRYIQLLTDLKVRSTLNRCELFIYLVILPYQIYAYIRVITIFIKKRVHEGRRFVLYVKFRILRYTEINQHIQFTFPLRKLLLKFRKLRSPRRILHVLFRCTLLLCAVNERKTCCVLYTRLVRVTQHGICLVCSCSIQNTQFER